MGSLISEIPQSEVNATLELLDSLGVGRDDLKRFRKSSSRVKAEVAKLIKGQGAGTNIIDCDADPFNPWQKGGWTVEKEKGGSFKWDASQVELYLASGQKNGKCIEGNKLRKELAKKPVLNANVLDYLLKNPHLIPEEWKHDERGNTRRIFFWGTIYRGPAGNLYVRYLYWSDGRWNWSHDWLGSDWSGRSPAAVRAS